VDRTNLDNFAAGQFDGAIEICRLGAKADALERRQR
jgi:hypothetical protein